MKCHQVVEALQSSRKGNVEVKVEANHTGGTTNDTDVKLMTREVSLTTRDIKLITREHDHLNLRPGIFPTENRVGPFGTICDKTRLLSVLSSMSSIRRDKFNFWG